jgi:hypothetical protein
MIVWALLRLLPLLKPFSNWTPWAASKLGCGFSKALSWASAMPPLLRSVLIGLATGLLPCGWLYAFVLAAVGTGSMLHGVGVLFAFWLGTLPALLGIGSLAQLLSQRFRRLLPALSACLLLSIGLGSLFTRYNSVDRVLSWHPSPPPGLDGTKSTGLTSEDALPPCHRH